VNFIPSQSDVSDYMHFILILFLIKGIVTAGSIFAFRLEVEGRDGFRFLLTFTLGSSDSIMITPFGASLDSADDYGIKHKL